MIQSLSFLIHALSKVGKSTLAASSPPPILALDVEGSWKFLPLRMKAWDPSREPPPRYDQTWDACVVNVREWATIDQTYQWLLQGEHDFQSLVIDSITEAQRRLKLNLRGSEVMQMADWGKLLTDMDVIIRGMRDLTLHPVRPLRVVVFVAETRQYGTRWKPAMQGQIVDALPYWVDVCGYMYVDQALDANNQPTVPKRRLLIAPHQLYESGERVQGRLPGVIDDPNITQMYMQVFNLNGQYAL